MRYVNFIYFIALFLCQLAYSQPGIGSAKALIKLEFEDIYGLKISNSEVILNINSIEKFNSGTQSNWLNSHLIVTGLKNFEIDVKTLNPNFFSNNIETNVSVSNILINARSNSKINNIYLSSDSQILFSEKNGGLVNYIDIRYQIPAEKTFAFLNESNKIFETLIVYTLIPN